MLFNSYHYILAFLPIVFLVYHLINKSKLFKAALGFLVASSLFYYGWWDIRYLSLIILSILINFFIGKKLSELRDKGKVLLTLGISLNLGALFFFKYVDFFIFNINFILSPSLGLNYLKIALPLAISFFTFQQIAFLVDSYRGLTKEYSFLNYCLFVCFFPQLIAGPIVHHSEMMGQFEDINNKKINYENISKGLFLFFIGLTKKILIADTIAKWVNIGFDQAPVLTFIEAWTVSLFYTFQLYFDFSGYTDMAIGSALLFNIKLPLNFNSPYKALNIQDFWKRWHMTLSRYLRDYVYIPLGGNREGEFKTYRNLFLTFLLGGLWHGAGWTFVFWGILHGVAVVVHRFFNEKIRVKIPGLFSWLLTFLFVNLAWVFFRATTWSDALKVLKGMAGLNGITLPTGLAGKLGFLKPFGVDFGGMFYNIYTINPFAVVSDTVLIIALMLFCFILLPMKNSIELKNEMKPSWIYLVILIILSASILFIKKESEFLYFEF